MTKSISNHTVKSAIDAWQAGDRKTWLSLFENDATLFDDGNPRDLGMFSDQIGKERFTSIDKVEDGGLSVYGQFHSDAWGSFKTYFKFQINTAGKIARLDIGQAE